MTLNNSEKKIPCPPSALFRPHQFRIAFLPLNLFACWAAAFFKARTADSWPWIALLVATLFVLAFMAAEFLISAFFAKFLAPAVLGFLAGTGVNVAVQGILNQFQGLNWTFQSPIQFNLGTVLLGFLGSLVFLSRGQKVRSIFISSASSEEKADSKSSLPAFLIVLWAVTIFTAAALCLTLGVIQRQFGELESQNPLRKPLWFSAGAVILVCVVAILGRKNLLNLGRILLPGIMAGLIWAYVVRDVFEGMYLTYPQFPLAPEVLEFILVINFCFLGVAWLNKAGCDGR